MMMIILKIFNHAQFSIPLLLFHYYYYSKHWSVTRCTWWPCGFQRLCFRISVTRRLTSPWIMYRPFSRFAIVVVLPTAKLRKLRKNSLLSNHYLTQHMQTELEFLDQQIFMLNNKYSIQKLNSCRESLLGSG